MSLTQPSKSHSSFQIEPVVRGIQIYNSSFKILGIVAVVQELWFLLRLVNNVLGGMTFVMLARLTGSQSAGGEEDKIADGESSYEEKLFGNEIASKLMV
ncbi:hypothetical protein L1987_43650 [Smallanthus sonchifolius]|uniref:Uncharacterized protein n=1 Tax=Smallanthus sonchifolius TaxID=185202 RepID=A0ACB9GNJ0_9ASTR|nr:hypothetical protein L1987_43650 [Smallanthus sonchifolius]